MELSASDWEALQGLVGCVGLPAERVSLLRRSFEKSHSRPCSPYLLIIGRSDAGIELLLARWLAPEAGRELQHHGDTPIVIGPAPDQVQPRLGSWPTWPWPQFKPGHIIALRSSVRLSASTLAQLASLGFVDQAILVTRLSQPLHMEERAMARSLVPVVATIRVLVVALPGEEPTENDLAEIPAFAVQQMQQAGFDHQRCLGAGIWFTDEQSRAGTIEDLSPYVTVDPAVVHAARLKMMQRAMVLLLREIAQQAQQVETPPTIDVEEAEIDRLTGELGQYLNDVGKSLNRQLTQQSLTTARAQSYALDVLNGWRAYIDPPGFWLKLIERLRPGTQKAFFHEIQANVTLLEYQPGSEAQQAVGFVESSPTIDRLLTEAKRLGIGLVLGYVFFLIAGMLLGAQQNPSAGLTRFFSTLVQYTALGVGVVLGYGVARRYFRLPQPGSSSTREISTPATLMGWEQFERRLLAWFSTHMRTKALSPIDECRQLAKRLGIEEPV